MKRKFTFLITAALMLLTMIVQPGRVWGQESYSITYNVTDIGNMFASGSSYESANGYWKVPASAGNSAQINIPITYQPDSDITITFRIATFGNGTNPSASNTTITAIGTETNSNWFGTGVSSYPSSSTHVNGVMTISKPQDPTTLGGLAITMGVNSGIRIFRLQSIAVEYTYSTGGGDLEDNDLTLSPTSLALDIHNNPNTGTVTYTTSSTGAVTVSQSEYVTTSVSGNTITVTPVAVTPSEQTITVSQAADATYAAGSATFTVNVTNSAPTVTVTYHANGGTGDDIVATPYQGSDYTVAANTFSYTGHSFTKWNTVAGGTGQDYDPNDVINNIQNNIDLYAQWQEVNEVVDYLDREFTGVSNGSTSYSTWKDKEGTSGAVYAGNSAGGNNAIQLRTTGSASGIVSTTSAGKVTKVEVQWNSNTSSGRKINIYGSNTAYTEASQLYNANTAGTLLGTIDYGSTTELTITGDYAYIGIRSQGNALYLDWVKITWATASSDVVATPVINPNGGSFWESQEVSISCATDGATIYYTTDGTDPTTGSAVYSASFTITATNTVKAFAVKADMTDSEIATAEFTKATPMTVAQALAVTPPQNGVYVSGIISEITEVSTQYHNATYKISDDGTHSSELTVFRGKYLNGANFTSEDQIQVGDVVVVYGDLGTYNEAIQLNQNNYLVSLVRPEKVATPTFSPAAGTYYAAQSVTIACETEGATIYYTTDGTDPTTESSVYSEAIAVNTTTTIKAFAVKEGINDSDIATAEYTIILTPSITVTPATANPSASDTEGTLDLTYANLTITDMDDFDIQYYDAGGDEATQPSWIEVGVAEQDPNIGEGYVVSYIMDANTVAEARTAYFKVYAMDGEEFVYSNLVTVTQAAFVVDYATLPFEFDGGRDDIATTTGLTQENLGTDYISSPKLKFEKGNKDNDGLYSTLVLQFNERPGTLTFDIKGNTFSGGTFTVQTSEDGVTYTDLKTYTELGNTQSEEFTNLGENVRYIKWIYTEKVSGNVGLGKIALTKYVAPVPAITVESTSIAATAEETQGTLNVTYTAIETDLGASIYWFESDSETPATEPDWISADINETTLNVDYIIGENDGEARTAYFKVCGSDSETNLVYSELVTVTQAAYIPPVPTTTYTLATSIESGLHYIITNDTDKAMGVQNNNNRAAVAITIENHATTITEDAGVYEVVINGPDANGNYTIYDKQYPGYLYAASSNSNYLKTREGNSDADSQWSIEFEAAGNVIITAQGNNSRNLMRYNSGSEIFSCYASGQKPIYLYVKDNDNNYEYYGMEISYEGTSIPDGETITVGAGSVMTVTNNEFGNDNPAALVIEDGGQLVFEGDGVMATMLKSTAHAGAKDGVGDWYTIASPLKEDVTTSTSNTNLTTSMSSSEYDLYRYNEATAVWENSKKGTNSSNFSEIELGRGYLYWREDGQDLIFAGELNNENVYYTLTADGTGNLKGFNLIGNPFSQNITMANIDGVSLTGGYVLTKAGGWGATVGEIAPCQGFLVQVKDETNITISKSIGSKSRANRDYIALTVANSEYEDVTYALFSDGMGLSKINHRNADIPMLYIPQNDKNYAIATMDDNTQAFELNFKAMTTGQYTLSFKAQGSYSYLHVIDRITGEDIDMLLDGEYTFIGSPRDNENRFIVKLNYNANIDEIEASDSFAYQYGNDIIVSGNGELQVFDVNGRMVMNTVINGKQTVNIPTTGLYIFRMVGESVKTQKIVVR